jgi:hypothetical protein
MDSGTGGLPIEYLEQTRDLLRENGGVSFEPGLSDRECERIEQRVGFRFPPDLRSFLQFALPVSHGFYDWRRGPEEKLREALHWPLEGMCFDIEYAGFWVKAWGPKPEDLQDRFSIARERLARAPRLIPVYGHRYIPDRPHESGNPIFSVWQTDIIYYGFDLADYFSKELCVPRPAWAASAGKPIEFWDLFIWHWWDRSVLEYAHLSAQRGDERNAESD